MSDWPSKLRTWSETIEKDYFTLAYYLRDAADALADAEARCCDLEDALQDLCDWQNGPPLISWTDGWTDAMAKAAKALKKGGGA
jgi:hypothetical protein